MKKFYIWFKRTEFGGQVDFFLYSLVCVYLQGGDLFDAITSTNKYTERDASGMLYNLVSAIKYLHSLNVVHRDIKPENLLVPISLLLIIHTLSHFTYRIYPLLTFRAKPEVAEGNGISSSSRCFPKTLENVSRML